MRPFRFGVSLWPRGADHDALVEQAKRAEDAGFDVFLVADHLGHVSPFDPLLTVAEHTALRLGTFVLNNDFHNPHLLARQIATVDRLTGGRLEVGIGAGHMRSEYETAGIAWEGARARQARLAGAVDLLDGLLRDEAHEPQPTQRPRPPFLVGGWAAPTLAIAARRAEIVGLAGLRQRPGAEPGTFDMAGAAEVDDRVGCVREQGAGRDVELNVLVQGVSRCDDPRAEAEQVAPLVGLTTDELLDTPFVLFGRDPADLAEQLLARRERWGISYVVVFGGKDADALAPVIAELRG